MKHKLKRIITLAILIVINFVLQSTVFGFHSLSVITPNLLLILSELPVHGETEFFSASGVP